MSQEKAGPALIKAVGSEIEQLRSDGIANPTNDRLVKAIKNMCACVLYHKGTVTLLGSRAIAAEVELFESLAAMTGQDRTALFHEIGGIAKDMQFDITGKEEDKRNVDEAILEQVERLAPKEESFLVGISVAPTCF